MVILLYDLIRFNNLPFEIYLIDLEVKYLPWHLDQSEIKPFQNSIRPVKLTSIATALVVCATYIAIGITCIKVVNSKNVNSVGSMKMVL